MPWYQLMGQAFELALKSCLAVDGVEPPHSHDLVALYRHVDGRGFASHVEHIEAHLVHLNHAYFEDLASGDRFTARYGGGSSWAVPDHHRLAAACVSFIEQSEQRNSILRECPPGPSPAVSNRDHR
ncbi:MAG: HEPN domain-containing protein [Gemmatimonadales bacterium]